MRNQIIGIISEGIEDQGVLKNILRAFGFDGSEIRFIRPDLSKDASDRHHNQASIGTFQGVKNACISRDDFERAFSVLACANMVVHLDTAEIDQQGVLSSRPQKEGNPTYSTELRNAVINLVNTWLEGNYSDKLLYAISIEEIEIAWCLTCFETRDTAAFANAKDKLQRLLDRKNLSYRDLRLNPVTQQREYFEAITKEKDFHKPKKLKQYVEYNQSLKDFILSVEERFGDL
jgi:hypothetical protein